MNKLSPGLAVAVLLVLLLLAGGYFVFLRQPSAPPVAMAPAPPPAMPEAASSAPAPPQIRHPLEAASAPEPSASAAAPLPALADADAVVQGALGDLLGRRAALQLLQTDRFIQRIVATVDNLPTRQASPRLWPVHPMAGRFTAREEGGALQVDPDNARRYLPLVQLVEAIDPASAAALYRRLYPLFQQAYRELGYPQGYFNDRLVEVIDHLQATPQVEGPLAMTLTEVKGPYPSTTPWLHYEFADPALQSLSAGQRALLRSGVVNQRRLLAWLSAFRAQVAP
jgi:Protein of unknown function (DUF3014)